MDLTFIFIALFGISILTNLTCEGAKKITNKIPTTLSAVIISTILSVVSSVLYCIYYNVLVTPQVIVEIIVLTYLSFLVATNGYDKVVECIKKIKKDK